MIPVWARLSLGSRLFLSTAFIVLLGGGALSYISVTDQAFFERTILADDLKLDLETAVTAITEHAIAGDFSSIQQILDSHADHAHIRRAQWADISGRLLEAKKVPVQKKPPGWFLKWVNIPDIEDSRPLDVGGKNYGTVFLTYTSAPSVNNLWHQFRLQLGIGLSGVFALLISSMLIVKHSLRPLYTLANSATQIGSGNYSVRIPDGKLPELLPSIGAFNDMAGKLQALILSLREREAALRESESRYRMLFHNSPVGVFNYDTQMRITDCNDRFVAIIGSSREKITGLDMNTLKDRNVLPCLCEAAEGKEGTYEGLYHATTSTAELWVSMHTAPLFDKDGKVISCVGIVEDITSRKEAEIRLRESELKYRKIFENVQDVFYQTDLQGNIIEISPSIQRHSGYTREELIGRPAADFYHRPEDRAEFLDAMNRKEELVDFEVRLKAKDGRLIDTSVNTHFIVDEAGNRVGIEGALRDVRERKRLEEQFFRSQKMEAIGQLAGGVAHDFNNILTAIIGYGELLQTRLRSGDPSMEYVDYILESADRAAQLVSGLLAFSRKQILNPKPEDLNGIITRIKKLLLPLIGENIELSLTLAEKDLHVIADSSQIEQALLNLAVNARDAMPNGGVLAISAGREQLDDEFVKAHGYGEPGIYAYISVSDTGTGMDEVTRTRIFEPFFTTKEVGKGTGLGLAMVYGTIKQHKGHITVYSELGRGTTFKIYLPAIEKVPAKETRPVVTSYPSHGTETILLAEDDETLRTLSQAVLLGHGYKVIAVEDGEQAVRRFAEDKENIRLLLLDMVMPKRNGKETYEEIKKIRPDIKVLFVSGYSDIPHNKAILDEGLDFMSKPVSPKALLGKVREILDR